MEIKYHKDFLKNYKKRIAPNANLSAQFDKQLKIFLENPNSPSLRNHKLIGKKENLRAFSITGDVRVVFKIVNGDVWLYDVGTHNQVY